MAEKKSKNTVYLDYALGLLTIGLGIYLIRQNVSLSHENVNLSEIISTQKEEIKHLRQNFQGFIINDLFDELCDHGIYHKY
jgi:hypothetical protein